MKIAGFKESSLNEWEGYISSIIWTPGCNWRCSYCHAPHLINTENINYVEEETIFNYINGKKGWIDGLCISGGEPTIQPDLYEFIQKVKDELNIAIKLETNGSNPKLIRKLLNNNMINCLSIDFKQLPQYVLKINEQKGGIFEIIDSYNAAFKADIEIEFHTTLCPAFINIDDIKPMAEFLHNKGTWILQQYNSSEVLNPDKAGDSIYKDDEVTNIYEKAQECHNNVILKNI